MAVRDRLLIAAQDVPVDAAMESDPLWRRVQLGWGTAKCMACRPWDDPLDGIQHLRPAAGEHWPAAGARLRARLATP